MDNDLLAAGREGNPIFAREQDGSSQRKR